MSIFGKSAVRATVAVTVSALLISSCAAPRKEYITSTDSCSYIREPFVQIKEAQQKQVSDWAKGGAAAGAAAGLAAGIGTRQSLLGTLLTTVGGAMIGGFAGAAVGYQRNLESRGLQTQGLRNAVFDDAEKDANKGDDLVRAVARLNRCRLTAIQKVGEDFKAGRITRPQAEAQLTGIKANAEKDNEIISAVLEGLEERKKIYVNAVGKSGVSNSSSYLDSVKNYKPVIKPAVWRTTHPADTVGKQARTATNVRSGPGTSHSIVAKLTPGQSVTAVREENGWTVVDYGSGLGYVRNDLLEDAGAGQVAKADDGMIHGLELDSAKRPHADNGLEQLAVTQADLSAIKQGHLDSIDRSIADTQALLI